MHKLMQELFDLAQALYNVRKQLMKKLSRLSLMCQEGSIARKRRN
jgi:hypothetical protein